MIKLSSYSAIIGGIGLNKVAENEQQTITYPNGSKYVGEFKDDKPNGQGTLTWPNGTKYVGEFKDGKRNGQGTFTWPGGSKYVGEFRDGKYNGQGTWTAGNGAKYVGEFRDGAPKGQGTWTEAKPQKRPVERQTDNSMESKDALLVSKKEREEGINQILEDLHAKKITPENAKMRLKEWASRNNGWMKTAGYPEDSGNPESMDAHRGEFAEEEKKGFSLAAEIVGKPIMNLGDEQVWKLSDLALAYEKLMGTNVNPGDEGSLSYPIGKLRREIKIRI